MEALIGLAMLVALVISFFVLIHIGNNSTRAVQLLEHQCKQNADIEAKLSAISFQLASIDGKTGQPPPQENIAPLIT